MAATVYERDNCRCVILKQVMGICLWNPAFVSFSTVVLFAAAVCNYLHCAKSTKSSKCPIGYRS